MYTFARCTDSNISRSTEKFPGSILINRATTVSRNIFPREASRAERSGAKTEIYGEEDGERRRNQDAQGTKGDGE